MAALTAALASSRNIVARGIGIPRSFWKRRESCAAPPLSRTTRFPNRVATRPNRQFFFSFGENYFRLQGSWPGVASLQSMLRMSVAHGVDNEMIAGISSVPSSPAELLGDPHPLLEQLGSPEELPLASTVAGFVE